MKSKQTVYYSILGMLTIEPMTGYDIRKTMEESTAYFWSESYGQIYPALKRMLEAGWVSCEADAQERNRPKKVYSITDVGLEILKTWLEQPTHKEPKRNELLLKLFFGVNTSKVVCKRHIQKELIFAEEQLPLMQKTYAEIKQLYQRNPHQLYWLITINFALHHFKAHIAWCKETLELLE